MTFSWSELFMPRIVWGAEWTSQEIHLVGVDYKTKKFVRHFKGDFNEAAAFAQAQGLTYEGFYGAVSHLPFKWVFQNEIENSEEGRRIAEEASRPQGIRRDELESLTFAEIECHALLWFRADSLEAFTKSLPQSLATLSELVPSPLLLNQALDFQKCNDSFLILLPEIDYTHLLMYRDKMLLAHSRIPYGLNTINESPILMAKEIQKALLHWNEHWKNQRENLQVTSVYLWKNHAACDWEKILAPLGLIVENAACIKTLSTLPEEFRLAGLQALNHAQGQISAISLGSWNEELVAKRRKWLQHAGFLCRANYWILLFFGGSVALMFALSLALQISVKVSHKKWNHELKEWNVLQKHKQNVEQELQKLSEVLSLRNSSAKSLQQVTSALPAGVWLESWDLESGEKSGFIHHLSGYALDEAKVSELLAHLEKQNHFSEVKLKSTEAMAAEKVVQKTGIKANHRDLVYFQMQVQE